MLSVLIVSLVCLSACLPACKNSCDTKGLIKLGCFKYFLQQQVEFKVNSFLYMLFVFIVSLVCLSACLPACLPACKTNLIRILCKVLYTLLWSISDKVYKPVRYSKIICQSRNQTSLLALQRNCCCSSAVVSHAMEKKTEYRRSTGVKNLQSNSARTRPLLLQEVGATKKLGYRPPVS